MELMQLTGKWKVVETTSTFKDKSIITIGTILDSINFDGKTIDEIIYPATLDNKPSISVEIKPDAKMKMTIVQTLHPNIKAEMIIEAQFDMELSGNLLTTQTNIETLNVKINLNIEQNASTDQLSILKNNTLQDLKKSPQWNTPNTVTIIYSGTKTFLTKSSEGTFMLHYQ